MRKLCCRKVGYSAAGGASATLIYGTWSPLRLAPDPGLSLRTLILKPVIH